MPATATELFTTDKLTAQWLATTFRKLSTSRPNGEVGVMEKDFKALLRELDFKVEAREAKERFDDMDTNGNGIVEFTEFARLCVGGGSYCNAW